MAIYTTVVISYGKIFLKVLKPLNENKKTPPSKGGWEARGKGRRKGRMEVRKEVRKVMRKVMGERERLTVVLGKKKAMVIYHDSCGWKIGDTIVGKLTSYRYFRYLIKREFRGAIRGSQIRWLYNHLKRRHIKKGRLGTNQTPNLLKRRERGEGEDWGRWENRQLARMGEMDGKRRKMMMDLMDGIYQEEFMGGKVFKLWSPMENLEGGGNPPLVSEPSQERGTGEGKEVGKWK